MEQRTTRKTRSTKKGRFQPKNGQWIARYKRIAIYLRDGFCCQYCGRDLREADWFDITLDHLRCQSKGGTHSASNLITACRSCNSARQAKRWRQYATGGAIERIERTIRRQMNRYEELAKSLLRSNDADWKLEFECKN